MDTSHLAEISIFKELGYKIIGNATTEGMCIILEKRNPAASVLRDYFAEQWRHLLQLVQESQSRRDEALTERKHLTDAVERIVDNIDSRMRGVGSYQQHLRESAHELLIYIQNMTDELPVAISIDKSSYINEPLINGLFASNTELEMLVDQSAELQKFVQNSKAEGYRAIYALLYAIKEERTIFGSEIREGLIQRDVAQTAVNFYGQQIIAPALSEAEVRESFQRMIFEKVIATIRSHMVKLRHSLSPEEEHQAALHPEQNINNPDTYLRLLTEQLGMPQHMVTLQCSPIRVSKMGIKLPPGSNESSNEFYLNEVGIGKDCLQAVALVRFDPFEWN